MPFYTYTTQYGSENGVGEALVTLGVVLRCFLTEVWTSVLWSYDKEVSVFIGFDLDSIPV